MRGVEPELQRSWDWRAATNFIGGGAGAGLFLFTALAARQDASWLGRLGFFAPLLVLLGLASVGSELGRPLRAAKGIPAWHPGLRPPRQQPGMDVRG